MTEFWNERYSGAEYVYGVEPNNFLQEQLASLEPGSILLPADGEGRNGVYAASQGWEVVAFDPSHVGRSKALMLATKSEVEIRYNLADFESFDWDDDPFDCLALIFAHMPSSIRQKYHRKFIEFIRPGGTIILEAFRPEQMGRTSGGPRNPDMLYTEEILADDFSACTDISISSVTATLNEGPYHTGVAELIRLVAKK